MKTIWNLILATILSAGISLPFIVPAKALWQADRLVIGNSTYAPGQEVIELRQENSKTTYLGKVGDKEKYGLDVSMGAIHYKDDYSSTAEQWKDIDLTFKDGKITKAPYDLTVNDNSVLVRDKKTGSMTMLTLSEIGTKAIAKPSLTFSKNVAAAQNIAVDTDLEIVAENTRIKFTRVLKSALAPAECKFQLLQVGAGIDVDYKAVDSKLGIAKETQVISTLKDGILTETIDKSGVVYPLKVDPTLDIRVGASADDCLVYWNGAAWVLYDGDVAALFQIVGYDTGGDYKYGGGMRFAGITIPNSASITTSYFNVTSYGNYAPTTVNSKITGNKQADAAAFSTLADYQARRGTIVGGASDANITAAQVSWNSIAAWTTDTTYSSPEIKTVVQEIVNQAGWVSGNHMAIFWDDHNGASTALNGTYRFAYSYDSSTTKCPLLHIEYVPVNATVSTAAASNVLATTATLNGSVTIGSSNITQRGFAWGTTDNATKPATTQAPPATYTDNYTESGNWGNCSFSHNVIGLAIGTTYYFRAYAYDAMGWEWGDQLSFTTVDTPIGNTLSASVITTTTARLNGEVTDDGGQLCDAQFGWDTASHALFADYPNHTALISDNYSTGSFPYADVTTFAAATTYHFRINITNDAGSVLGNDLTFTTTSGMSDCANFVGIPASTSISYSWTKGTGAAQSLLRYSSGAYPATVADGTAGYLGTGSSVSVTGLTPGTTIYATVWGKTGAIYSSVAGVHTLATTLAYDTISSSSIDTPAANPSFLQTPDATKTANIPLLGGADGFVQANSDAYGMPVNMIWYLIWMVAGVGGGIVLYNRTSYNLVATCAVDAIWFGFGAIMGLTMMWIVVVFLVIAAGFTMFGHRH